MEDISLVEGFEYEVRVAADSQRDNEIRGDGPNATDAKDIQAACAAGAFVDQGDTDLTLMLDEIVVTSGLTPYTGYLLCYRHANTAGATGWAVPDSNEENYTNPARPPTPRPNSARSTVAATNATFVWEVGVRSVTNVPRENGGYSAKLIEYHQNWEDANGTTVYRSTRAPA